jgi:hypothetical protein
MPLGGRASVLDDAKQGDEEREVVAEVLLEVVVEARLGEECRSVRTVHHERTEVAERTGERGTRFGQPELFEIGVGGMATCVPIGISPP